MSKNTSLSSLINYVSANSSGNVTIAAPSSGLALDVSGTGRFTGALTLGAIENISITNAGQTSFLKLTNLDGALGDTADIDFSISGSGTIMSRISSVRDTIASVADISLAFSTYNVSLSEKMRILGNGNVGIGTSSPIGGAGASDRTLSINSGSGAASFVTGMVNGTRFSTLFTSSTSVVLETNAAIPLAFNTNATERMRITSGGNININTTSAYTSRLNVQAAAANRPAIKAGFGASAGNGYWILGDNYTLDESLMSIGIDYSSGGLVLGSALAPSTTTAGAFISTQAQFGGYGSAMKLSTSGEIYFYNGTQNSVISAGSAKTASIAMTILQTGKIGIGTTSPAYNLSVSSFLGVGAQGGNDIVLIGGGSGVGAFVQLRYADGTVNTNLAGNGNALLNTTYGNVLIGTTSDNGAKLQVNGNITSSKLFINTSLDYGGINIVGYENGSINIIDQRTSTSGTFYSAITFRDYYLGAGNAIKFYHNQYFGGGVNKFGFSINGDDKLTILNSGRVGIGIATPGAALQVAIPGVDDQLILGSTVNNRDHAMFMCSGPNQAEILRYQSGARLIFAASTSISNVDVIPGGTNGVRLSAGNTSWSAYTSDARRKKNFESVPGLDAIMQVEPVKYHFNTQNDTEVKKLGFTAQNILPLIPEMVHPNGEKEDDGSDTLTIIPDYILPVLVQAIKDQQAQIEELKQLINK